MGRARSLLCLHLAKVAVKQVKKMIRGAFSSVCKSCERSEAAPEVQVGLSVELSMLRTADLPRTRITIRAEIPDAAQSETPNHHIPAGSGNTLGGFWILRSSEVQEVLEASEGAEQGTLCRVPLPGDSVVTPQVHQLLRGPRPVPTQPALHTWGGTISRELLRSCSLLPFRQPDARLGRWGGLSLIKLCIFFLSTIKSVWS